MMNFCTLFDSYYLDKGLALYKSLENVTRDFKLFIFCFDDKSYEILRSMKLQYAEIIHHSSFENELLLEKKKERSKAEYCWTCTSITIEYVLNNYDVDSCTYLDSDLYFYSDPAVLFDEIEQASADVCIVEHRFKDNSYGRKLESRNGKYCVEFNYFRNNDNSRRVLGWWKDRCLEWCYDIPEPDRMGDQKYLNQFRVLFDGVHELQHLGGGVAPWNLEQYQLVSSTDNDIIMRYKENDFRLVFYHFQNIRYFQNRLVNIKSQTRDKRLKYSIYIPYLLLIEDIRRELIDNYGLDFTPKKLVRSSNKLVGFLQSRFAALKVRHISDVINLDRLSEYKW